ncbi:hypothetical protein GCM10010388_21990 [Streptomyces mauvecolor]
MCAVVGEEELPRCWVGQGLGLVVERVIAWSGWGGEHEDPQAALKIHPSRGESPAGQTLQVGVDLGGERCHLPGGELAQAALRGPQGPDTAGEFLVDLVQGPFTSTPMSGVAMGPPRCAG